MSTLHVENLKGLSSGGNANKIIVPSGQTIDASAGTLIPSAGAVTQVVHTSGTSNKGFTNDSSYSSTSYTDVSGATLNITPAYSSSKIFIISTNHIYSTEVSANSWRGALIRIVRTVSGTATDVSDDEAGFGEGMLLENNTDRWMTYTTRHVVDSPNTTSQVNYKVQAASKYGNSLYINRSNYGSGGHLIAMEIKA